MELSGTGSVLIIAPEFFIFEKTHQLKCYTWYPRTKKKRSDMFYLQQHTYYPWNVFGIKEKENQKLYFE